MIGSEQRCSGTTGREKGKLRKTGSEGLDAVSFACENLKTGYTMFLSVKIESKEHKFVIDAGSAVTIILLSVFNEILSYVDLNLRPTNPSFRIVGVDTKPINLEGHASVNFRLQNSKFSWDMYVADIREDGIIGLDFLIEHYYTLEAKTGLRLNRKDILVF